MKQDDRRVRNLKRILKNKDSFEAKFLTAFGARPGDEPEASDRQVPLTFPKPLWEKHQPRRVRDFIGLLEVKRTLEPFVKAPYESAWFFLGATGTGKTALVQAVAEEINAQLSEIPSAECNVDRIRAETAQCLFGAWNFTTGKIADWHLLGIHEAHSMTLLAQEALLSKLDATAKPPRTIFIFTANSTQNLGKAFMSRVQLLEFTAESVEAELPGYLETIYKKEGGTYPLDFAKIAKAAQFDVRNSLNRIQNELLLGTNRKGLPTKDLKILPEHIHDCEKCNKPWKCTQLKCKLPHLVAACPTCGGAKTIGTLRALKAWDTMRKREEEKRKEEIKNALKDALKNKR